MISVVSQGGNKLLVIGRDKDGKRTFKPVTEFPYFYVKEDEKVPFDVRPIKVEAGFKSIYGDKLKKLTFYSPSQVKHYREKFNLTFEADVLLPDRWMLDNVNDIGNDPLRVHYMDIEVDSLTEFAKPDEAKFPITYITVYDSVLKAYVVFVWSEGVENASFKTKSKLRSIGDVEKEATVHVFGTELDMIRSWIKFLRASDPDVLAGWNFINYDMQYIFNRLKHIGLDVSLLSNYGWAKYNEFGVTITGRSVIDLLSCYKRFSYVFAKAGEKYVESYSLDSISEIEIGARKVQLDENMGKMWRDDYKQLFEYVISDVELTVQLDDKLKLVDGLYEHAKICCGRLEKICGINDKPTNTAYIVDMYLLRFAKKHNFIMPSKDFKAIGEKFKGAYVMEPKPGLHKNVAVFDIKSLYPSLIRTFNLSPEMLNVSKDGYKINQLTFSKQPRGLFPAVIDELISKRFELKAKAKDHNLPKETRNVYNMRQNAAKTILNSMYGVMGYSKARMFKQEVAETVTFLGRELLKYAAKYVDAKEGLSTSYQDTDSCFVKLGDIDNVPEVSVALLKDLNKSLDGFAKQYGADEHCLEWELDKVYSSLLFMNAQKRYLGWQKWSFDEKNMKMYEDEMLHGMGMFLRRRDSPAWTKTVLKEVYTMITRDNVQKDTVLELLMDRINEVKKIDPVTLGLAMRIGKNPAEYLSNNQQGRGMDFARKHLKRNFSRMDFVRILFIRKTPQGMPNTEVLTLRDGDKLPKGFELDYDRTLRRILLNKLQDVFDALEWPMEDLENRMSGQKSIFNFVK